MCKTIKYIIIYKCRMCGKDIETVERDIDIEVVESINRFPDGDDAHCFHECDNGDIGLCDLQGFRKAI